MGLCGFFIENIRKLVDVIEIGSGMVVIGDWGYEGGGKGWLVGIELDRN